MSLDRRTDERDLPVRLGDIKPVVRLKAAVAIAQKDPASAVDVLDAAMNPSSTVYWISDSALPKLLEVAACPNCGGDRDHGQLRFCSKCRRLGPAKLGHDFGSTPMGIHQIAARAAERKAA